MATYRITGPDGKTYRVTGESPEGALQALQKHLGAAEPDPRDSLLGKVDAFVRGAADTLTFGLADEVAAGMGALTGIGGTAGDYEANLAAQRALDAEDAEERGGYRFAGQLAGGLTGGAGLARAGLSPAANVARAGGGLGKVSLASAGDGAVLAGLHGAGSGEGLPDRVVQAALGAGAGTILGGAAPGVVAGVTGAVAPLVNPIMSRVRPERFANQALGDALRRTGQTPDDIVDQLRAAAADDQGMFTVADAMGHGGGRLLSAVTRTPNAARQGVADALVERQVGQSERLSRQLAEGFEAPDTAKSRVQRLEDARRERANELYSEARREARLVDVTPALREINDLLRPGPGVVVSRESRIADDTVEGAARKVERMLTDGDSITTDFSSVLRIKQDVDDMIKSAEARQKGNQARVLTAINKRLDEALARASPAYRRANDTYARESRVIDAVAAGHAAKSGRTRAEDNIRAFNELTEPERRSFRVGYADPLIADVEAASLGPLTNRARPLLTEKTRKEFRAFAPSEPAGARLLRQLERENQMFQTANAALGGSKTADNLADMAEMSKFDPGVVTNLLHGRPVAAAVDAVTKLAREAQGLPPQVMERVAAALMETNPQAAKQILVNAAYQADASLEHRVLAAAMLRQLSAAGAGRAF